MRHGATNPCRLARNQSLSESLSTNPQTPKPPRESLKFPQAGSDHMPIRMGLWSLAWDVKLVGKQASGRACPHRDRRNTGGAPNHCLCSTFGPRPNWSQK